MNISKVQFSKTYNLGDHFFQKIGVEMDLIAGEDAKDALAQCKLLVEEFASENNIPVVQVTKSTSSLVEMDAEFDEFKKHLDTIEFREEAQTYLESSNFKYTYEAKNLVQLKPLKH